MGHWEDIWYATNIQIIDYMEVVNRLKFSADGESVYNPSAKAPGCRWMMRESWKYREERLFIWDEGVIEIAGVHIRGSRP